MSYRHHIAVIALLLTGCSETTLSRTTAAVTVDRGVNLGTGYVGDRMEGRFAIHSTGSGRVWVEAVRAEHTELNLHWDTGQSDGRGTPVPAGGALPMTVRWKPLIAGALDTTIEVRTNVEGQENWTVGVSGNAQPIPSCDDGNPCTDDWFERSSESCVHRNNDAPCSDGSACTIEDECHAGVCRGVARSCDDDNVCTLDLCDPTVGCVFPPDGRVCDDGDPCTDNVCDPDDGCSYPNAPIGTPCGSFDCAIGHLCFFGDCRELDISGESDGYPCFDGDVCTSDDTCQAGACVGGPVLQAEPEIVAAFDTFGGEGSTVATDGYRYLFADPDALRLAIPQGVNGDLIAHVATLPFVSRTAPVLFEPGKFVVASHSTIALVDATDTSAPFIAWEVAVWWGGIRHLARANGGVVFACDPYTLFPQPTAGGPNNPPPDEPDADSDRVGGTEYMPEGGPFFLPIAAGSALPGVEVMLAADYDIRDLAVDGTSVAWVSGTVMHWLEIDTNGAPQRQLQRPMPALGSLQRVSIDGTRLAVLGTGAIEVWQVDTAEGQNPCDIDTQPQGGCELFAPGCDDNDGPPQGASGVYMPCPATGSGCPSGTACELRSINPCLNEPCAACAADAWLCMPQATVNFAQVTTLPRDDTQDLVLAGGDLYRATSSRVELLRFEDPDTGTLQMPLIMPRDDMSGTRLDRGPASLMLAGAIALPLRMLPPDPTGGVALPDPSLQAPTLVRVTGPRHGNVVAITDAGGSEVLLGGRVSWARIDLADLSISQWEITDVASGADRPRVLRGINRDAVVTLDTNVLEPPCDALPEEPFTMCNEAAMQLLTPTGELELVTTCNNYGNNFDVSGGTAWSYGTLFGESSCVDSQPSAGVRVWRLQPGQSAQLFSLTDNPWDGLHDWWSTRVRAADGEPTVALLTPTGLSGLDVDLLRVRMFDATDLVSPLRFDVTLETPRHGGTPARDRVGIEGSALLVGEPGAVTYYDLAGMADPVWPTQLTFPQAIPTEPMQVTWMNDGRAWVAWTANATAPPGPHLTQVTYDTSGALVREGDVQLPGRVVRLYDSGGYSVATTPTSVVVVAPSCQ